MDDKKPLRTLKDDALKIVNLIALLSKESDRGCVLVASAYLEDCLRTRLSDECRQRSDASDTELNSLFKTFDSQFANFSSCIRLARAMGFIKKSVQDMLLDFGVWRNKYAHGLGGKKIKEIDLTFIKPVKAALEKSIEESFQEKKDSDGYGRILFTSWSSNMYVHLTGFDTQIHKGTVFTGLSR